jgi:ATP-binding cassette subfamily B protein
MRVPTLLFYTRAHLWAFLLGGLCLLGTNALGLVIPRLLQEGVDTVAAGGDGGEVAGIALWVVAVAALQAAIRVGSRLFTFFGARNIEYEMRNDLYAHLTTLSMSFYRERQTGDVISRASNDLTNVRVLLGPGILNIINTGAIYIAAPVLLLLISPWLTALALLPYPLMYLVARHSVRGIYLKTREAQEELSRLSSKVQENLTGVAVVKAYTREAAEVAAFASLSEGYMGKSVDLARHRARIMPIMGMMGGLAILVVLLGGGYAVREKQITLGEFVAFAGYLGYLVWPTLALGWILSLWQRGIASWERIRELFAARPALADPEHPLSLGRLTGGIEIRDLRIQRRGETVLDIGALRIPAGTTVAIVGRTGSGKTTLAEVLARLTEIPPSTVFVDGVDVTRATLADYRRQVSYVPQETFLFSATVAENIALGRAAASREEIARVAGVARLDPDLAIFPEGLDTVVGERGITLSGGQRQRVAIARALLVDPRILLLDDCLSAVDVKTEREILAGLSRELAGRTALVISHRLAAARLATEIVVLDAGRVAERGTHEELCARGGLYADLWRRQTMLEALEGAEEAAE